MGNMTRKILAVSLSFTIFGSTAVFPVLAAEVQAPAPTVTVTVEDDGTTTKTSQSTTIREDGGTVTTQTDEIWESSRVTTDSHTATDGHTTTTVEQTVTTEKQGSQTTITAESSHAVSGSTSGTERTDVTDTTTTVTVAKDGVISSETAPAQSSGPEEAWVDATAVEGDWQIGSLQTDTPSQPETSPTTTEDIPWESEKDVTLTMTNSAPTDTQQVTVTPKGTAVTLPESGTTTVPIKDDSGKTMGYEITTVTVQQTEDGYRVTTEVAKTGLPSTETTIVTTSPSPETPAQTAPAGFTPGQTARTETNGNTTVTTNELVTEIKNEAGDVIGYTIETTTSTTQPSAGKTQETTTRHPTRYILPQKPEASVTTDEAGYTTTVTVGEILEDGTVVGYQKNLVITDPSGTEVYAEQEKIYQTVQTETTVTTQTPETTVTTEKRVKTVMGTALREVARTTQQTYTWNTTVDTTEEIYKQLTEAGQLYVVYQGQLFKAEPGENHGTVRMTSIQPDYKNLLPAAGNVDPGKDLYHRVGKNELDAPNSFEGYDFEWLGTYGLESAIRVRTNGGASTYQAHQFVLQDRAGNAHYVYCADLMTDPRPGFRYNMENILDADYCDADSAAHIQAIAVNGYWATAEGIGSLESVKAMLKEARTKGDPHLQGIDIENLTEGEALTATQAAIWVYGNSNTKDQTVNVSSPVGRYYTGSSFTAVDAASKARVEAMFQYLCNVMPSKDDTTTPLITANDFATETAITVKEKATDEDGNTLYKADLSFNLSIQRSKLTGNLKVQVLDNNGKVLAEKVLATDDSNLLGQVLAEDDISSDGTYVFHDLEIAANTKINLTLSGTQNLGLGAYLYTAEIRGGQTSQTFVGLGSGEREVNLSVGLQFNVTEPTLTTTKSQSTRTDRRTDTKKDTVRQMKLASRETTQTQTEVLGTVTVCNTLTQSTYSERDWNSAYYRTLSTPDGAEETPSKGSQGSQKANVPKTGDGSALWAALSILCLAGFLLLGQKRRGNPV